MLKDEHLFLGESGNKVNTSWPKNKYTLQIAVVTRRAEAPGVQRPLVFQKKHVWIVRHFNFCT